LIVDKSNVQYLFPVSVKLYPNLTYYTLLKDTPALLNMKENSKANKIDYLPEIIFFLHEFGLKPKLLTGDLESGPPELRWVNRPEGRRTSLEQKSVHFT